MKSYVVGFMFDSSKQKVVLIRKNKPEWQKGKLNGVGGKIEVDETPIDAMIREYKEETGVIRNGWDNFLIAAYDDCIVYFFKAFDSWCYEHSDTTEEEQIEKVSAINIPDDVIDNLQWIIRLALDEYVSNAFTYQRLHCSI